jgi:hypothetical protein
MLKPLLQVLLPFRRQALEILVLLELPFCLIARQVAVFSQPVSPMRSGAAHPTGALRRGIPRRSRSLRRSDSGKLPRPPLQRLRPGNRAQHA